MGESNLTTAVLSELWSWGTIGILRILREDSMIEYNLKRNHNDFIYNGEMEAF